MGADCYRNGIRRYGRYGLGLDHCHDFHPMRCNGYGRAMLCYAHEVGCAIAVSEFRNTIADIVDLVEDSITLPLS